MSEVRTVLSCSTVVMIVFIVYFWMSMKPVMPPSWRQISLGMERNEALRYLPDMNTSMYKLKGFDLINLRNSSKWYPSGGWQMIIGYTEGVVTNVRYLYANDSFGIFNVADQLMAKKK